MVAAMLALTGCADSGDNAGQQPPTGSAAATTSAPGTSPRVPECTAVATSAGNLATQVGQFLAGDATANEVRAALQDVTDSLAEAKAVVGADTRARLDDAEAALQRAQTALNAQPVDLAELRAAAKDAVDALLDVVSICAPSSATPASTPTTSAPGATPTS
jgi:hypothetical protein